ncbi:MAG: efflux RND transporter periplasmic adaptor subunit [Sediminibacterium sp.]|nr:efflux RND transporter periplasmic adaptor subunit [Sediminibacterium sp.]
METALDSIAIEVATAVAVQKPFNFLISSSGKIVSKREDLVNSPINGKLITCIAVDGKSVLKNEVIVQFDTRPILFKKERAILHKYNTEKEYESVLLGYENLLKGKNEASADSIKNKLRIGVGLADAQQDLVEANYELMNAQVIAPFNGLIANVLVHSGQTVKSGQEMFRIYDPNELFLTIKVLESDLSLIKLGFVAQIFPLSFEKEHYSATVASINPYVEETGMIVVLLRVDNAHGPAGNRLFPGMNCTATISIPCPSSIVVPKEAIVNRSGRSVVFTVLVENPRDLHP